MDFNGDETGDLIFGNASGEVIYYSRKANGDLHFEEKLKANNQIIDYNTVASIAMTDWNNDGLHDLVMVSKGIFQSWNGISYSPTPVRLYINEGTKQQYKFNDFKKIELAGSDEGFIPYAHVAVADLNGDGKKDILLGGRHGNNDPPEYHAHYFENIGTDADPKFDKDLKITSEGKVIECYFGPFIDVTDWNKDGTNDLLFGMTNRNYNVKLFLGKEQVGTLSKKQVSKNRNLFAYAISSDNRSITLDFTMSKSPGDITVSFVNVNGRVIFSKKGVSSQQMTVPLRKMRHGVFLLTCKTDFACQSVKIILL